jgi:hypothetical protein
VLIYYGVTNTPGISSARMLSIPSLQIPADGAFHVYRFDLGLEIFWRGTLRDVRIDPLDSTGVGKTFALDYVRVGDVAGDIYLARYSSLNPAPGANNTAKQPSGDRHVIQALPRSLGCSRRYQQFLAG